MTAVSELIQSLAARSGAALKALQRSIPYGNMGVVPIGWHLPPSHGVTAASSAPLAVNLFAHPYKVGGRQRQTFDAFVDVVSGALSTTGTYQLLMQLHRLTDDGLPDLANPIASGVHTQAQFGSTGQKVIPFAGGPLALDPGEYAGVWLLQQSTTPATAANMLCLNNTSMLATSNPTTGTPAARALTSTIGHNTMPTAVTWASSQSGNSPLVWLRRSA